jgi:hypothetical protein
MKEFLSSHPYAQRLPGTSITAKNTLYTLLAQYTVFPLSLQLYAGKFASNFAIVVIDTSIK